MIKRKTIYIAQDGSEHATLKKAIDTSETVVSNFFREALENNFEYTSKMELMLMEFVLDNRQELRRLLDFDSDPKQFDEEE